MNIAEWKGPAPSILEASITSLKLLVVLQYR